MIRLAVSLSEPDSDGIVLSELLELSPAGVEERALENGGIEYVIYGAAGELPSLPSVEAAVGSVLVSVSSSEIPDDWSERWKVWHRPVDVSWRFRRMRVRPPWEASLADPDVMELVVDPAQAFGTGAHATTRLCLELLLSLEPGGSFADWGTGTGVLALAALSLGYSPVRGCDLDPYSLAAASENAALNGLSFSVSRVNLRSEPGPVARTVCANLVRPLLLDVARLLVDVPERLIVSGLLRDEADEVAAAFAAHGLAERERRSCAEWSALLLERQDRG